MNPIDTKVRKGTYDDAPGNDPAPFCFWGDFHAYQIKTTTSLCPRISISLGLTVPEPLWRSGLSAQV